MAVLSAGCSGDSAPPPAAESSPQPSAATASAPASGTASTAGLDRFYAQRLRWEPCGGAYRCARLSVPLDYAKPDGRSLQISVIRLPATQPDDRVGSLVINPGGPGVSGIGYARVARAAITAPVRQRFDIVGFDPRGVAASSPVDCVSDRELDRFISTDGTPDNLAEQTTLLRETRSFTNGCATSTGDALGHLATRNVARDMDILRAALGDERLYYLGKSYGTFIGATYAELFPARVGRLVLDGALDPRVTSEQKSLAQARGFEQALTAFVDDCLPRAVCPLSGSRSHALGQIRGLLRQLDRLPLPTRESRRLTESLAVLGVAFAMYETQGWPALAVALRLAFNGDGSGLLQLSDFYTERRSDGRYEGNLNEATYAVNCLDRPPAESPIDNDQVLGRFRAAGPTLGVYLAWSDLPCAYWPVPPVDTPHRITASGAAPILVVGTTRDPATPYEWALGLAEQLESGVLLTYVGDGHTAYARGSSCIDSAVEAYLLRGQPPRAGLRCS